MIYVGIRTPYVVLAAMSMDMVSVPSHPSSRILPDRVISRALAAQLWGTPGIDVSNNKGNYCLRHEGLLRRVECLSTVVQGWLLA